MKERDETSLVEVFTGAPWEAEIKKGLLESSGISAIVKDGIMGAIAPYIGPEVSVMVNETDYEAATEAIQCQGKKTE